MNKIKLAIVVMAMTILTPNFAVAATATTVINCGEIIEETIPFLGFEGTTLPGQQDIDTAECMSEAILECDQATSTIYSGENNTTNTVDIRGQQNDDCKIYIGAWDVTPAKLCTIPMEAIEETNDDLKDDPDTGSDERDYLFHGQIYMAAIFISTGWTQTSGPDITCQNAEVTTSTSAHSEGINVLGTDGTMYRIVGSARSPYTSAGAFLSYKFNSWATAVPANAADMALPLGTYTPNGATTTVTSFIPPRNGALINDKGTVYLITGGGRAGFATEAVFKGLGYSYSNVYAGDTSFMGLNYEPINSVNLKHHDGTLINDNGTLYVMRNGYRVGFPSMAVLDSWGYWPTDAVPANSYDRAAEVSGVMSTRMANQLSI